MTTDSAPLWTPPTPAAGGYVLLDDLFAVQLEEEDYEIPGRGRVRIRALSRTEVLDVRGKSLPFDEVERRLVSLAMVAPRVSHADVKRWQDGSGAGEIEKLTRRIMQMSKLQVTAEKETVAAFREGA